MELKRRIDPRVVFVVLYVLAFAIYIIVGLRPVEATNYTTSAKLSVPAIGLVSDVTQLTRDGGELTTPDQIVGSYSQAKNKTLLIGHSTAVFRDLADIDLGVEINYNDTNYKVIAIDKVPKSEINMRKILAAAEQDTVVIMTCSGQLLGDGDATHRLIVTATKQ